MSTETKNNPRDENPRRQCAANDGRLDTQNGLPTAQQLYSKGKLVTDAEASADSILYAAMQSTIQSDPRGTREGHSEAAAVAATSGSADPDDNRDATQDQVVSPHISITAFTSVNDQCDWLNEGGGSSPITNDSNSSYQSDADTIFDLFNNFQIDHGDRTDAGASTSDRNPSTTVQSTSDPAPVPEEVFSVSTS